MLTFAERRRWMMSFLLAPLALAGCPASAPAPHDGGSGDGSDDGVTTVEVAIRDFAFVPNEITIRAGQRVRWTNEDLAAHTVTSGDPEDADAGTRFNSNLLTRGGTFSFTFESPGRFEYFCIPHASMASMRDAAVVVEP